ncbi:MULTISPECIES: sigma-54-dependent transcriptional regulator [Marinobacter]|jgi:two-component system C4-dicarboxylate transport response regulator DctD|uniref:C4-dicarboxylate transport transcriptional regulatory protein DctD n=2 Tax=Marinobacter salarius TaxID=1420917 RepID=A0A1W6KCR3_9GAMM|nr:MULTISPECIES: sigma-54 dependent transcriptional regulator [Marinobacter]ARM85230.1 C4-dicarboxylate transport transcriptional regulatory protein DctD [Marinobacter salarius]KXJ46076.1 MAG: C4-dicarboxylate ABC transporter [Marinobacter sp. Hex_13]MBL82907.1 sigma-54-dependent Fis family transcriptional regulator [Marinobacter sp.]MBS8229805.1 sigma-54-dependent Fis family transcriptional regulator [Marinobacter salarius]MCZ4284902.1 sigma-54 dependent transcriptional regulator [Marinobacte|tara:strand:- start:3536 stop:4888 length:1353 start_codon:yes stop_codon:yes gene_type:complete
MTDASVIFVDDDPHIRQAIAQTLTLEDLSIACFEDARSGLESISQDYEGVVLCDYNMPGMDGLEMLDRIRAMDETIPVIILTGQGDISTAVTAMQQGAYDFIEKPFDHDELLELLRHALEKRHLALENRRLKAQLKHLARPGPRILGDSAGMQKVMATIDPVLDISANILLHGETGSGKDALARYIHENSPRSAHNFVAINCGAVPENLIESELFGHEAGAFTGAEKRRIGKIEYAHKGTLFLDELESMPMALQVKLLRVLEEQRVERLGSNQVQNVDVRIIAATKADLKQLSDEGEFRADLYYRLNVVKLDIPPLRERKDDIPVLFHHFVLIAAARYDRESIPLDASQAARLMQHSWPGNVRELRNLAERYVLLGPAALDENDSSVTANVSGRQTLSEMMDDFERSAVVSALNACHGSIKDTMVQLGIARKTLYDKMKKYGLDKSQFRD